MAKRTAKSGKKSRSGRLRIVAGIWRSRLLQIADVPGLRPTSERIRETLFNWLAPRISGARCLDLFAGSGALGLEALSRGAAEAVFVEKSAVAASVLQSNIELLGDAAATVCHADAFDFLHSEAARGFDIVFLDPPFAADMLDNLCRLLDEVPVFADGALVYLEEDRASPELQLPEGWRVMKSKTAGNVRYSLVTPDDKDQR
ncbi:MAG: 16S rRNA (guanine(966)-N(2))-methyltransferase RsmD [Gammaproteobacteria bacterium]|nr:16S rRNA (guanine(966)-N(2))-methyltransferase RsmD [Gammaproteobacteria bacterium]MDH3428558.1 16S rRNA (guanine(966)-N(2))-methyltransferase RsmD [Gammaproteobacteria bacterium]MDH3432300.1 16S rRNA (guanine(966)-N(2))-methyltransferase RsmD [Gammaproteobacteria bacterium]